MDQRTLQAALRDLPLGGLRFYQSIGSTNDEALAWAMSDAPHLSLVIADEQTAGRGRGGRTWITPPGSALAFSLILRPSATDRLHLSRIVGLAALVVVDSLQARGLMPQIKWPNDVLVNGQKVAGILVESVWSGEEVDSTVLGIGVNVMTRAVPAIDILQFPAISLEEALGYPPQREELLHDILKALIAWYPRLGADEFLLTWENLLAFRGQQVQVFGEGGGLFSGELCGLEADGSLRLRDAHGKSVIVHFGDVRLRPLA